MGGVGHVLRGHATAAVSLGALHAWYYGALPPGAKCMDMALGVGLMGREGACQITESVRQKETHPQAVRQRA